MAKRSRSTTSLEPISDETVARIAYILGDQSAAAVALAEAKSRRERGESIQIFRASGSLFVGPPTDTLENYKAPQE